MGFLLGFNRSIPVVQDCPSPVAVAWSEFMNSLDLVVRFDAFFDQWILPCLTRFHHSRGRALLFGMRRPLIAALCYTQCPCKFHPTWFHLAK